MNENNNYENHPLPTPLAGKYPPVPSVNTTQPEYSQSQSGFNGQQVPYPPMNSQNPNAKSKLAAGLLGIFLGALGAHNFYLGYTGKAIAQLLISLLSLGILACVSSIWGTIEGILILASQPGGKWNQDANGIPLRD